MMQYCGLDQMVEGVALCAVGGLLPLSWFIYRFGIAFLRRSLQPLCAGLVGGTRERVLQEVRFLCRSLQPLCSGLVSDTRERVFKSSTRATICPPKYSCVNMYFMEGTVNPRCWHSFDNEILDTIVRSRLGSGIQKDSLGSSFESPYKWP